MGAGRPGSPLRSASIEPSIASPSSARACPGAPAASQAAAQALRAPGRSRGSRRGRQAGVPKRLARRAAAAAASLALACAGLLAGPASLALAEGDQAPQPVASSIAQPRYLLAASVGGGRSVPVLSADVALAPVAEAAQASDGDPAASPEEAQGEGAASPALPALSAVTASFSVDGCTYAIEPDGATVALVAVDPSLEGGLELPEVVTGPNDASYSLTRICSEALKGAALHRAFVPRAVDTLDEGAFSRCSSLSAIDVDADNQSYFSVDGLLYDRAFGTLICVPAAIEHATLTEGCSSIAARALEGCLGLRTIRDTGGVAFIDPYAFGSNDDSSKVCPAEIEVALPEGHDGAAWRSTGLAVPPLGDDQESQGDLAGGSSGRKAEGIEAGSSMMAVEGDAEGAMEPVVEGSSEGEGDWPGAEDALSSGAAIISEDVSLQAAEPYAASASEIADKVGDTINFADASTRKGLPGFEVYHGNGAKQTLYRRLKDEFVDGPNVWNQYPTGYNPMLGTSRIYKITLSPNGYLVVNGYRNASPAEGEEDIRGHRMTYHFSFAEDTLVNANVTEARIVFLDKNRKCGKILTLRPGEHVTKYTTTEFPDGRVHIYLNGYDKRTVTWNGNQKSAVSSATNTSSTTKSVSPYATVTAPSAPTAPKGHQFLGWSASSGAGSAVEFKASSTSVPIAEDITFYGQWAAKQSALTFDLKDGTGSTPNAGDRKATYGKEVPAYGYAKPVKTGCKFLGFFDAETEDGNKWYTDGGSLASGVPAPVSTTWNKDTTSGTTLYAQWEAIPYTVSYTSSHGKPERATDTIKAPDTENPSGSLTVELPSCAADDGYVFTGWTCSEWTGTKASGSEVTFTSAADRTVTASFSLRTYEVTLDTGAGTLSASGWSKFAYAGSNKYFLTDNYTIETASFTLPTPDERGGFEFLGWTGSNGTTPQKSVTVAKGSTGSKSYTASWHRGSTFDVTLDPSGGYPSMTAGYWPGQGYLDNQGSDTVVGVGGAIIAFGLPVLTGYEFQGYYDNAYGTGMQMVDASGKLTSNAPALTGPTTWYAKWKPIDYTISFSANWPSGTTGTTGSMASVPATYDANVDLPPCGFIAPGWTAVGWNTRADGTGTWFPLSLTEETQAISPNLTTTASGTGTLYCIWRQTNAYALNGAQVHMTPMQGSSYVETSVAFLYGAVDGTVSWSGDRPTANGPQTPGIVAALDVRDYRPDASIDTVAELEARAQSRWGSNGRTLLGFRSNTGDFLSVDDIVGKKSFRVTYRIDDWHTSYNYFSTGKIVNQHWDRPSGTAEYAAFAAVYGEEGEANFSSLPVHLGATQDKNASAEHAFMYGSITGKMSWENGSRQLHRTANRDSLVTIEVSEGGYVPNSSSAYVPDEAALRAKASQLFDGHGRHLVGFRSNTGSFVSVDDLYSGKAFTFTFRYDTHYSADDCAADSSRLWWRGEYGLFTAEYADDIVTSLDGTSCELLFGTTNNTSSTDRSDLGLYSASWRGSMSWENNGDAPKFPAQGSLVTLNVTDYNPVADVDTKEKMIVYANQHLGGASGYQLMGFTTNAGDYLTLDEIYSGKPFSFTFRAPAYTRDGFFTLGSGGTNPYSIFAYGASAVLTAQYVTTERALNDPARIILGCAGNTYTAYDDRGNAVQGQLKGGSAQWTVNSSLAQAAGSTVRITTDGGYLAEATHDTEALMRSNAEQYLGADGRLLLGFRTNTGDFIRLTDLCQSRSLDFTFRLPEYREGGCSVSTEKIYCYFVNTALTPEYATGVITHYFDANGGTSDPTVQATLSNVNSTLNVPAAPAAPEGFTFAGWYTDSVYTSANSAMVNAGTSTSTVGVTLRVNDSTATISRNFGTTSQTLYALWSSLVELNANDSRLGGTNDALLGEAMGKDASWATWEVYRNEPLRPLTAAGEKWAPVKPGWSFAGFYESGMGSTCYYGQSGTSTHIATKDSPTALYAKWTRVVTLDPNGGLGSPQRVTVTYGDTLSTESGKLPVHMGPTDSPTGAAWAIDGYYDSATGGTRYVTPEGGWWDAAKVTTATVPPSTLYAVWKRTVTVDEHGGSGVNPASFEVTWGVSPADLEGVSEWDGRKLLGYFTQPEGGDMMFDASGARTTECTSKTIPPVVHAQWKLKDYPITYLCSLCADKGDEVPATCPHMDNSANPQSFTAADLEDGYSVWIDVPEMELGYAFDGWTALDPDSEGGDSGASIWGLGPKRFMAHNLVEQYTVHLDANGGAFANGSSTTWFNYTIEFDAVELERPKWPGHSFAGWVDAEGNSFGGTIPAGSTKDRDYTATWETLPYEIFYHLDGGALPDGIDNPYGYDYDTRVVLPTPAKRGYAFLGWTDDEHPNGGYVAEIPAGSWGPRSFTAHWKANDYVIRFDLGEGQTSWPEGEPTLEDGTAGLAATYDGEVTLPAPKRAGHVFAGWSFTESEGEQPVEHEYEAGVAYGPLDGERLPLNLTAEPGGEATLVAKWEAAVRVDVPAQVNLVALTDWANDRIEVSGGDNLRLVSRTTADVAVTAIADEGVYEGDELAAAAVFKDKVGSTGITVAAAAEGSPAHRVPFGGSIGATSALAGLVVPAVGSSSGPELPVRYGLDVAELGLEDIVPWVESTPIARLTYTVALADPTA